MLDGAFMKRSITGGHQLIHFLGLRSIGKNKSMYTAKKVDVNSTKDLTVIWTGTWMCKHQCFCGWWLVKEQTWKVNSKTRGYQHQAWGKP